MDRDTLRQLASLSKLRLTPDEEDRLGHQVERVLGHFAVLQELDTDDVEPCPYPVPIPHRTRPDEPGEPLTRDEVLANAPSVRGGCFLVPRTVQG